MIRHNSYPFLFTLEFLRKIRDRSFSNHKMERERLFLQPTLVRFVFILDCVLLRVLWLYFSFIAETSLTIEDVAFVIDTGRAKEKSYDPHLKTSTLQEAWISQASAKQRRGRAGKWADQYVFNTYGFLISYHFNYCYTGRCKAGVCFHLFSKRRHASMRPFVESELVRTPLEEICLQWVKSESYKSFTESLNLL